MGKQENQQIKPIESKKQPPKKIIKKIPFKTLSKSKKKQEEDDDDDLKDWKPMKISQKIQQHKQQVQKQKHSIANSFLSSLSKPKQESSKQVKLNFDEKTLFMPKQKEKKKVQLTQQQIKWDIQDQSFIKKQFQRNNDREVEHELIEEDDDEEVVDKIEWLNEQKPKMKEIDMTKVVDKNWQQQNVRKNQFKNDIWSSSLLKGKGQISQFVKQAIQRYDEDEATINKHNLNKKNIRSRYGW